ncbi:uncharacterized protein VTP21DRAFT_1913 [Calcarisporiella thermophila]|uniref:uncharacterized protein n=1 Tax=Calcarisporiella thermophila TaxID=911321 RepID=UPI003743EBD3
MEDIEVKNSHSSSTIPISKWWRGTNITIIKKNNYFLALARRKLEYYKIQLQHNNTHAQEKKKYIYAFAP